MSAKPARKGYRNKKPKPPPPRLCWRNSSEPSPHSFRAEPVEALPFLSGRGSMTFWTYMLHCNGGYFYIGHTDDLERRIAQHESGTILGFTRDHLPVKLVWSESFPTRYEAQTAERRLKGWSRAKKLALIRSDWNEVSRLGRSQKERQAFGKLRPNELGASR